MSKVTTNTEDDFLGYIGMTIKSANLITGSNITDYIKETVTKYFNNFYWHIGERISKEENSRNDWFASEDELYEKILEHTKRSSAFNKKYKIVDLVRCLSKTSKDIMAIRKEYTERNYTQEDFRNMKKFYLAFPTREEKDFSKTNKLLWSEITKIFK